MSNSSRRGPTPPQPADEPPGWPVSQEPPTQAPTRAPGGRRDLPDDRRSRAKSLLRRMIKPTLGVLGLGFVALVVLIGVAYVKTPIPSAKASAQQQATILYYRDGKTQLARLGTNRIIVPISDIPPDVQHAVIAAEQKNFYSEPGISPTGIARAVWSTVTGRQVQGGSTITQQMARNYYSTLSQQRSISRKIKEIFIAVKVDRQLSKNEILDRYLNTIYFGRGANGIEAAAQAYFHTSSKKLTVAQAAYLAAVIQSPEYLPFHPDAMQYRWNYVLNTMVEKGWLSAAERQRMRFPTPYPRASDSPWYRGFGGYMIEPVKNELVQDLKSLGYSEAQIANGGLRVTTTFDPRYMKYAQRAVQEKSAGMSRDVQFGLAAVQPGTGEVLAVYGGPDYLKHFFNNAFDARAQVGSSFKPYVLAAALEHGISLRSTFDGRSPQTFQGGYRVSNDSNEQFGVVDLVTATAQSINTVYVKLAIDVGLDNVISVAERAGIPDAQLSAFRTQAGIALGQASLTPVEQAAGFATFASQGVYARPHVVRVVKDRDGNLLKRVSGDPRQVLSKDVTADLTYALQRVVTNGTGTRAALPDRPVAGKTGTVQDGKAAWFVGYTPQLSAAVGMWPSGSRESLDGIGGYSTVYGGNLPAAIWRSFMEGAMEGKDVIPFPPPVNTGTQELFATPTPTATASPTPSRVTRTPTPEPTPTESAQPFPRPSRTCSPWPRCRFPSPSFSPDQSPPADGGAP